MTPARTPLIGPWLPPPGAVVFAPEAPESPPPRLDLAVERALALLPRAGRMTVLVNDPQRHTDSRPVLAELARRAAPGRLRVLIASGSHTTPPGHRAAFERSLLGGQPVADVAWHDSRSDRLVPVGPGGAWRGHPWLLDGDGLFAIGSVEPHYFAGFTGAHKTATVGVAAYGDIEANHAHALRPDCRPARLDGNPVAEGVLAMLAALQAARPVGCVNLVQAAGKVVAAFGGEPAACLRQAAPLAEAAFVRRVDRPADAVVAEVAGPLAASFYQADKGIKNNEWAVRDGGCLLLVAACPAGVGQDHFLRLLREAPTWAAAEAIVRARGYRLGDHKAVRLRRLTDPAGRGVRGFLVSGGIAPADAATLGLAPAESVPAALAAGGVVPGRDDICCVRDAGNLTVLPRPPAGD
ncbi:MAG TPA: lactate racemase domain-containing protein [Phycisphaerae bacterium]|nr:lactate racemase domain-containing protein [Phycisphaerae bacterium]